MTEKNYKSSSMMQKYQVYQHLKTSSKVKPYLPETRWMTKKRLEGMLSKYATVYVKPNVGSLGLGIYRVKKIEDEYELRGVHKKKKQFKDIDSLYKHLQTKTQKKMLLQKGISLEKIEGKPYDIRVMVQRKPGGLWTKTGAAAKVGSSKKIVTNYHQGGRVKSIHILFRQLGLNASERSSRLRKLKSVSLNAAKVLSQKKSGMHEMGIDYAYDSNGNLWIIEVNSRQPGINPMKKIDKSMYQRMMTYARSYGRNYG